MEGSRKEQKSSSDVIHHRLLAYDFSPRYPHGQTNSSHYRSTESAHHGDGWRHGNAIQAHRLLRKISEVVDLAIMMDLKGNNEILTLTQPTLFERPREFKCAAASSRPTLSQQRHLPGGLRHGKPALNLISRQRDWLKRQSKKQ